MYRLTNVQVIDTYVKAIELNLEKLFILQLEDELRLRGISPNTIRLSIS
ncbi:sporulation histidine kinase inhibitor Sda [Tenuibacillus multivorans]|uniref:Sporulation inhibitor A n=1 Tax=Tenuibacillus multivorans TaxID=237069 RepID=A0A1G9ZNP6_9BACI|nr:sporulation histidine kinase inhibitor Sda [Tenuibacillus multivorans]GEL78832.1 hypothetical protein TMU01_30670 [Tenuibacillus multivorans]SDN22800.1 Sporulation inhibitor A [Tenuibacillus multivorans]